MGLLLAFVCPVCAQVTGSKVFPLHVEASLESGTSYHKMMPMGAVADLGYYTNRFSLHAVGQQDRRVRLQSAVPAGHLRLQRQF